MRINLATPDDTARFGEKLGAALKGGEVIELVGDIGAGKTALTKGIARGMGISEEVQSPTFTISRVYDVPNSRLRLAHYDFYRLEDAGILSVELQEATADQHSVAVIEWAGIVDDVLPADRLTVRLEATKEDGRTADVSSGGPVCHALIERISP